MMQVSQKSRYALRALFELARHYGEGPIRISDIAEKQAIPVRFLEAILNQLKQAGFVTSVRGAQGGYILAVEPQQLTVGDMMRFTEGPLAPTGCVSDSPNEKCPLYGDCVFQGMWKKAGEALAAVYDATTFQDLLNEEMERNMNGVLSYAI